MALTATRGPAVGGTATATVGRWGKRPPSPSPLVVVRPRLPRDSRRVDGAARNVKRKRAPKRGNPPPPPPPLPVPPPLPLVKGPKLGR